MDQKQIWFARLSERGGSSPRMTPVSREGWFVVAAFVGAMVVGAIVFASLMVRGQIALAVALYAVIAILGGGFFLWASVAHGDKTRTADDYWRMRHQGERE